MAHTCSKCGSLCHCKGDIDDLDFGERWDCNCACVTDDDEDDFDELDFTAEDALYEEDCERAASCKCGAWQFNSKGQPIHIADCFCGAD